MPRREHGDQRRAQPRGHEQPPVRGLETRERLWTDRDRTDVRRAFGAAHRAALKRRAEADGEAEAIVPEVLKREPRLPGGSGVAAAGEQPDAADQLAFARRARRLRASRSPAARRPDCDACGVGRGNRLVRRSSAVCSAIRFWFGPRGVSSTTTCRSRDRPEVSSAIHTSTPLRDGSIRIAATACSLRALASIGPWGALMTTSTPSKATSARIRPMNGSAGSSTTNRTRRCLSGSSGAARAAPGTAMPGRRRDRQQAHRPRRPLPGTPWSGLHFERIPRASDE